MKKILLAAMLLTTATTAMSYNPNFHGASYCGLQEQLAFSVMQARQNGVPKQTLVDIHDSDNEFTTVLLDTAYEIPRVRKSERLKVATEFAFNVHAICTRIRYQ